ESGMDVSRGRGVPDWPAPSLGWSPSTLETPGCRSDCQARGTERPAPRPSRWKPARATLGIVLGRSPGTDRGRRETALHARRSEGDGLAPRAWTERRHEPRGSAGVDA